VNLGVHNNFIEFCAGNHALNEFAMLVLVHNADFELVSSWLLGIHRLRKHLDSEGDALNEVAFLFVIVFKGRNCVHSTLAGRVGVPGSVVARGITAVELEAANTVKASVHKGDAKGSSRTELGSHVLSIRNILHELLDEDWCVHGVCVLLSYDSAFVNQVVCVSNDARHGSHNVLVNFVELATLALGHEQLAHFLLFSCKDHAYRQILVKSPFKCAKWV
jgi:hypothetical protein